MIKTFVAALLVSCVALADPPADAPIADVPGASVHLAAGQSAPFAGYLVSDDETLRRGKAKGNLAGTLADAEANGVLLPRAAVAALIGAGAAAVVASISLGIALAATRK